MLLLISTISHIYTYGINAVTNTRNMRRFSIKNAIECGIKERGNSSICEMLQLKLSGYLMTQCRVHVVAYYIRMLKNDKSRQFDLSNLDILLVCMIFHAIFGSNSTVEVPFLVRAPG